MLRIKARTGIAFKFLLSISLLIVVTSVTLGWFFSRHDVEVITLALLDRGKSLLMNLTSNLGYELQYATEQRLQELIEGVIKQEDVLYVVIQDKEGHVRAQAHAEQLKEIPPMTLQRSALEGMRWTDPSIRVSVVRWRGERIYELAQPVKTRVKREREEIGLTVGGEEQTIGQATVGMSLSVKRVNDTIVRVRWTIALLTLSIILLGILVTAILAKVIVGPIKRLAAATKGIAEGEPPFEVRVASKDEIGDLAASFNRMTETLRKREIDNTELFRALEETNQRLDEANRHKSQFLANVSHELRTPMNAVIGFSEVLLDPSLKVSPAEHQEFLENILASGKHLLGVINELLDLSKVEAGKMEMRLEEIVLPDLIEAATITVRPLATKKVISIEAVVDKTIPVLKGDRSKINQVLLNLLGNAIKFTPEGGRVAIEAGVRDGAVEVIVSDTGIGIKPEDQTQVFEAFQQVETAGVGRPEGTGLGLTLAKKFVEMHGGRIWVTSEGGRGSTFTFTLPLSRQT